MSRQEMKSEINQTLDQLSGKSLEEILRVVKQVGSEESTSIFNAAAIQKLLSEDKELLEKLAQ